MMKPRLAQQDLHLVVNAQSGKLKCFDATGRLRWTVEARTHGANGPNTWAQGGDTPPGLYSCGEPQETLPSEPKRTWNAYGKWFVDLVEHEDQERERGRAGIGLHGGGSATPDPLAPRQGWAPTHGCVRVQNADLEWKIVPEIQRAQRRKGTVWLTVDGTEP